MDTAAFYTTFMMIFDRLLDKDEEYTEDFNAPNFSFDDYTERVREREKTRALSITWPREEHSIDDQYTNGYLHLIRMFHRSAPELLQSTIISILENYKFKACAQVYFLLEIAGFVKKRAPEPGYYVPAWAPDLNAWDDNLFNAILDAVIAEENKSLMDLLIIHPRGDKYRVNRLARSFLYHMPDIYFRRYYYRLIERSKKVCPKSQWIKTFDAFIIELLEVVERASSQDERSFYGDKIKRLFSPEEIEEIAKNFYDAHHRNLDAKVKRDYSRSDKYLLMRLWDFHPITRNILRDEFYSQFNALKNVPFNLDDSDLINMFTGTEKLTTKEKQKIIATLYRKINDKDRFDALAKKLKYYLGQENFQRLQIMKE